MGDKAQREIRANRLREARKRAGYLSAAKFWRTHEGEISISESGYRHLENGTRPIDEKAARNIAPLLARKLKGVTWHWLLFGEGVQLASEIESNAIGNGRDTPNGHMFIIDELDVRASGGPGAQHEGASLSYDHEKVVSQWRIPREIVRAHTSAPQAALKIINVVGDSMTPLFNPGDRVLVDVEDRKPSPPGNFAVWDGFGQIIKRLEMVPYSEPPMVRLISANADYSTFELPLADVIINGRVVGKWTWT